MCPNASRRLRSFRWKGEQYFLHLLQLVYAKKYIEQCFPSANRASHERLQSGKNVPVGLRDTRRCTCFSEYRRCFATRDTASSTPTLISFFLLFFFSPSFILYPLPLILYSFPLLSPPPIARSRPTLFSTSYFLFSVRVSVSIHRLIYFYC